MTTFRLGKAATRLVSRTATGIKVNRLNEIFQKVQLAQDCKTSSASNVSKCLGRSFHSSSVCCHGDDGDEKGPDVVDITFIDKTGCETQIKGRIGERLLYLAHRKGIDMEGACEASLACTTCHCYVETEEHFDILPEATETEEDLLDMAPFLDTNSRLGCQILLTEDLSGMRIRLPRATKNFYVDGHKPQPH